MAGVTDEEELDIFDGRDLLVVFLGNDVTVGGDAHRFEESVSGACMIQGHGDICALHLLAELIPVNVRRRQSTRVKLNQGAVIIGIAPSIRIGTDDKVLGIPVCAPFLGRSDAGIPVVPVVGS